MPLPFKIEFGETKFDFTQNPQQNQNYCMMGYLYLSYCKSLEIPPNEVLVTNLLMLQMVPLVSIDFIQLKVDQKSMKPLFFALKYIYNLKYLLIPGTETENIFEYLQTIIENNLSNLMNLLIDGFSSLNGFCEFTNALESSSVASISFRRIDFSTELLSNLFEKIPKSAITKIKFFYCKFEPNLVKYMMNNIQYFSKLSGIALNDCDLIKDRNDLVEYFQFLSASKISKIELIGNKIDIGDVFSVIDQMNTDIPLYKINLSKNDCVNFTGRYKLPITLNKLILARVRWTTNSLISLLSQQQFTNKIALDLSFLQGNINDLHASFPKTQMNKFSEIKWNMNTISAEFFVFLRNCAELRSLSLNDCTCEPEKLPEITNAMVFFVQTSKLRELQFRSSPQSPHPEIVNGLFSVIRAHQTIDTIDISYNDIGDNGIQNFVKSLEGGNQISRIAFDGSNVNDPQLYITVFQKLSAITKLKYVEKPRHDLERLANANGSNAWKQLEEAWMYLSKEIIKHQCSAVTQPNNETLYTNWEISVPLSLESYNNNSSSAQLMSHGSTNISLASSHSSAHGSNTSMPINSTANSTHNLGSFTSFNSIHRVNNFNSINNFSMNSNNGVNRVEGYNSLNKFTHLSESNLVPRVSEFHQSSSSNNNINSSDNWTILRNRFSLATITGISKFGALDTVTNRHLALDTEE